MLLSGCADDSLFAAFSHEKQYLTLHTPAPYSPFLRRLRYQLAYRGIIFLPHSACQLYLFPPKRPTQYANDTPTARTMLYHLQYKIDFYLTNTPKESITDRPPAFAPSALRHIVVRRFLPLGVAETQHSTEQFATLRYEMQEEAISRLVQIIQVGCHTGQAKRQ